MVNNFDPKKFRCAAFDLDETLLSHGKLSEFTAVTLERLSKSGVEIIIATGRALSFVPESITSLPFIRYIVSACGTCVTDMHKNETIWSMPLGNDKALEVISLTEGHLPGFCVYYDGLLLHDPRALSYMSVNEPPETMERIALEFDIPVADCVREYIENHPEPVLKLDCYFHTYAELTNCWSVLESLEGVQLSDSMGVCIEVTKRGVGKAGGLCALLERLGISPENVAAFGDSGNDIDMLDCAGYAVAMGSAADNLLELADYIALTADKDGAAKAILELFFPGH